MRWGMPAFVGRRERIVETGVRETIALDTGAIANMARTGRYRMDHRSMQQHERAQNRGIS